MRKSNMVKQVLAFMMIVCTMTMLTCLVSARETVLPEKIYAVLSNDKISIEIPDYDNSIDTVSYKKDGSTSLASNEGSSKFSIPSDAEYLVFATTDKTIEAKVPSIVMSVPGESGYWYNESTPATFSAYTVDTEPKYGASFSYNTYGIIDSVDSGSKYTTEYSVSDNGEYGIGFVYEFQTVIPADPADHAEPEEGQEEGDVPTPQDTVENSYVYFIRKTQISCFDTEEPEITWERIGTETNVNPGLKTKVKFIVSDAKSGIRDVEVTNNMTSAINSIESPYEYEVNQNGQLIAKVTDNAGNFSRAVVTVTWYKSPSSEESSSSSNPIVSVDPSSSEGSSSSDLGSGSSSTGSSSNKNTNNSGNIKLYNTTQNNSNKSNSTWDKYWASEPAGTTTAGTKANVATNPSTSTESSSKTTTTITSKPVTPKGYTYVYRGEDKQASEEEISREIENIVGMMKSQENEEINPDDIAITANVTLVKDEEVTKDSTVPTITLIAAIAGVIACGVIIIGFVILAKKVFF